MLLKGSWLYSLIPKGGGHTILWGSHIRKHWCGAEGGGSSEKHGPHHGPHHLEKAGVFWLFSRVRSSKQMVKEEVRINRILKNVKLWAVNCVYLINVSLLSSIHHVYVFYYFDEGNHFVNEKYIYYYRQIIQVFNSIQVRVSWNK